MNREPFETAKIYHIYNRGTEKRSIFMDAADRPRFLYNLQEFNDENPALNWQYKGISEVRPQKRVVDILAYCLMPNHYHLMLRQIRDNGITSFMRKIGTGYTMYFNKKYGRSGALFQGKFKSVLVDRDEYLRYLPHYIHMNPREIGVTNLQTYQWSSCSAFIDSTNSSSLLTDLSFMRGLYPQGYAASLMNWVQDNESIPNMNNILLD